MGFFRWLMVFSFLEEITSGNTVVCICRKCLRIVPGDKHDTYNIFINTEELYLTNNLFYYKTLKLNLLESYPQYAEE